MTDRKQAPNHLEFTEFAINHADEGIAVVNESGSFIYVNDAQCRNLDYSREELLSMSVSDIDPSVTLENWPSIWGKIREAGSSTFTFETEHRTRSGEFLPIELSTKYGVFNGDECCVAIVRDITARKKAEEALRKSEERLRLIAESSAEIMYQLDLSGRITYVSPVVERVYGYTPEEILNLDHTPFFPESEYKRVAEAINKTLEGENFQLIEFISKRKDNSFFPIEVSFTPTNKDGDIIGVQGITRDITERKQAEKEREGLITELQKALKEIKNLRGILPICSSCKKIRDDKGYWNRLEAYMYEHADVQFSHGLCPDCMEKIYLNNAGGKDKKG